MKTFLIVLSLNVFTCFSSFAQHGHNSKTATTSPLSLMHVLTQQLSDPEMKDYKMTSSVLTIVPGGIDTAAHRHDCDLFGYVLEGSVTIGLEGNEPKTFKAGEMFFEKRNTLHTLTHNNNNEKAAQVLLIFIIRNGRNPYTAEGR